MIRPRLPRRSSRRTNHWARPADSSSTNSWKYAMAKGHKNDGEDRERGGFKASRHGKASAAGPKAQQKLAAEEREKRGVQHTAHEASRFIKGQRIDPRRINGQETVADLIEGTYLAYNAARLREACQLFTEKMLEPDVTVGLSITGALTPAGLGMSALIPLIEGGFVDWIISTGANLYHDTHFGLGLAMHRGNAQESDVVLREKALGIGEKSLLAAAYSSGVPIYTSSPGDSSIGMNIAALALDGNKLLLDPNQDVNETASIVLDAKRGRGKSAVMILGGGSPKNFMLQTEPQIQEVLGIDEKGHDYFLQITDARPDTGGLSGATPAEAVSWGKIDPDR